MHANINVLIKQLSALALFFVLITAAPSWAQEASRIQERPLHITALQQLNQPVLRGAIQQSLANAIANSFNDGTDPESVVVPVGGTANADAEAYNTTGEDPPAPLNGGGEDDGNNSPPPDSDYDRVVHDYAAAGIAGVAQEQGQEAAIGNYPNPFNPETTIRFDVRAPQQVRLEVFNALGQRVQVLVDGWVEAGVHEARFEAHTLPSGTYFSRLITEAGVFTSTMVLAR